MIEFVHKLPTMKVDEKKCGTYNNTELAIPGILTTTDSRLGEFMHTLRKNLYGGRSLVFIDGKVMMVNKNWIRDHVHTMKGFKHFEHEMTNFLDFIIDTQRDDGQFYELIKQMDDPHLNFVSDENKVIYPEDNLYLARLELEADVEYLVVEGALQCYRITGDDAWLERILPKLEKSIDYMTSSPKRFDKEHGLIIRPCSIDTWDYTYDIASCHDRNIYDDSPMSIMHGDNSGVYQAMNQLAYFNRRLGREEKACEWEKRAEILKENIFKYLWNGKYFIHQLHLNHKGVDDKENIRLSLSNTYDINRGLTSIEQSRSIVEEYMERRSKTDKFAEWFTIDPPYEKFNREKDGEYLNGAISPFTAGELAKAAFSCGYEAYGWDIIERFMTLTEKYGDVYFLYYPDSTPQPDGGPSAWGSAALLSAIDEGLAGVADDGIGYNSIKFSPKFAVTPYKELRYFTGYEKTDKYVDIKYILTDKGMRYDIKSPAENIDAHILLPEGKSCSEMYINGEKVNYKEVYVGTSLYADVSVKANGNCSFELIFN